MVRFLISTAIWGEALTWEKRLLGKGVYSYLSVERCNGATFNGAYTAQKMKFSFDNFFSKYDQIRNFLRIWSHLLKKPLRENFIFCAMILERRGTY